MKSHVRTFLLLFILVNFQAHAQVVASNTVDVIQQRSPVITRQGEFLLDTTIVSVPGIGEQCHPAVAFNGTNYLLVWTEYRNGEPTICGARMNPQGIVLDTEGIVINSMLEFQQFPSVASDGGDYFVVWKDYRRGVYPCLGKTCVYGFRISYSGTLIDTSAIEIAEGFGLHNQPVVAFDGTNYLVVWEWRDYYGVASIYGARVSTSGVMLDTSPFFIAPGSSPALSFDGTHYLVAWEKAVTGTTRRHIFCTRVTQAGVILDKAGIFVARSFCRHPAVSFDGMNYLIVWEDMRNDPFVGIYGARVSPSGLVLDTLGIPVSIDYNSIDYDSQLYPSVVFEGTHHLVVWQEYDIESNLRIRGTRISTSGIVIDKPSITISTGDNIRCLTAACSDGSNYLVAWQDRRSTAALELKYDIYTARIDQSGQVIDPSGIPVRVKVPAQQSFPGAAFDGTNYLVVWQDYRSNSSPVPLCDIYGIRVNQSGAIIDSSAIAISDAPNIQLWPAVAFDGTNYFVVWEDMRDNVVVYGTRVNQAGVVIDTQGIKIPGFPDSGPCSPAIAFDGRNYLVVFTDIYEYEMYTCGTLVSPTGKVFDPFRISQSMNAANSAVAFGDTNYLIVWGCWDIYAARVTPSGIVLDEFIISAAPEIQCSPSIAFDGTNFLVVWCDSRKGDDNPDIYGARVSSEGVVLDSEGIRICGVENYQTSPSVTFDGSNYIVVWEDYRSDSTFDIYGAEVSPAGLVIDTFEVVIQRGDQLEPQLTRGNSDQILLVYSGWTHSINAYPTCTQRIWGKFSPLVGIEEHDDKQISNCLLLQINPNPFRYRTDIRYQIPVDGDAEISIYDVTGRLVKFFGLKSGISNLSSKIMWSGEDNNDRILPNGIYFCRLKTRKGSIVDKIVFLR